MQVKVFYLDIKRDHLTMHLYELKVRKNTRIHRKKIVKETKIKSSGYS